jgi:hypothetical protein
MVNEALKGALRPLARLEVWCARNAGLARRPAKAL